MKRLISRLFGKPFDKLRMQRAYRPGDYYKYYSALNLALWQSAGVAI